MDREGYTDRVRGYFLPLLEAHGDSHLAVGYTHAGNHLARYQIMCGIGDLVDASILDVGCGVGHFAEWLFANGYRGDYLGVDLLPEMIGQAHSRVPHARFDVGDILDPGFAHEADYVMANGIFHLADWQHMQQMIAAMYRAARVGVAFNTLSNWSEPGENAPYYLADPVKTIGFCRSLTPAIMFRHDYLPHDFTIFLFKDAADEGAAGAD